MGLGGSCCDNVILSSAGMSDLQERVLHVKGEFGLLGGELVGVRKRRGER